MTRKIQSPGFNSSALAQPIELGGTGATTPEEASLKLGYVRGTKLGQPGGVVKRDAQGKLPSAAIPTNAPTVGVTIGPKKTAYAGIANAYQITNYDSFKTYTVTADVGTVSISGDTITYTAPSTVGSVAGFKVNGENFPVTVVASVPVTPTITSPLASAVVGQKNITLTSSAFTAVLPGDTHLSSRWQVATDNAFGSIVIDSGVTNSALTSYLASGLQTSQTYYVRVMHTGASSGSSAWSTPVGFTTKTAFLPSTETAQLYQSGLPSGAQLGYAVAISGDNTRIIVGAHAYSGSNYAGEGRAYIFSRSGTAWTLEVTLNPNANVQYWYFGGSVGMDGTGTRVVVGAFGGPGGNSSGEFRVYLRTGTSWTQEHSYTGSSASYLGYNVGINYTGDTVMVTVYGGAGPGGEAAAGYVLVWRRSGVTWSSSSAIYGNVVSANLNFGRFAKLSGDGSRFITIWGSSNTRVSVYAFANNAWSLEGTLEVTGETNSWSSCNLDASGSRAILGYSSASTSAGAAYVFARAGTVWALEQKLPNGESGNIYFGSSVALDESGSVCAVAGYNADSGKGAVYLYSRTGSTWALGQRLVSSSVYSNSYMGYSGYSLAVDRAGTYVVAGAAHYNSGVGNAYVFS